ncbi:hypothetical protein [Paraburkholderia humisilvae]|uniref:Uncharacterized protein n=1 Tax=Paraburkholderia humisilvae TaxID=627669 RepID=A0A6J5DMH1_9BURK|nr:hypothetical protein [Paraburkholderia humisilvae]CAB3754205.1 hypothetical protein LMG29542_02278 [Paraburkholderia humisilvae]
MPGISRQELKEVLGRIIQPMESAYIYKQARQLVLDAFEDAIVDLRAALKELPAGRCAQFGLAQAEGEVWSFWLTREGEQRMLWASGTCEAVFEDAIDPTHYDGISVHDAQIATRLIRAWLVSADRKTASYPVATLREARERLAAEQL